jgi:hypothetical protein
MVALFPIVGPLLTCAQGTPTSSALVAREIAVLELAGGGTPLTTAERQQAAEAVASAMRGNPQVLLRNYAALAEPLQRAAHDRAYAAGFQKLLRYTAEENKPVPRGLEQAAAIERRIVFAHDRTVVFDPARQHIITEAGLRDFCTAAAWLAREWNLPAPTPDFTAHLRNWFRTSYLTADKDLALVLATQGESFPFVAPALARVDPKRLAAVAQQVRQQLQAAGPTLRDLGLAESVAVLGAAAARKAAAEARFAGIDNDPNLSRDWKDIVKYWESGEANAWAQAYMFISLVPFL